MQTAESQSALEIPVKRLVCSFASTGALSEIQATNIRHSLRHISHNKRVKRVAYGSKIKRIYKYKHSLYMIQSKSSDACLIRRLE